MRRRQSPFRAPFRAPLLAVVVLAVVSLVAGCGGERPAARGTASPSVSPSPSATVSVTPTSAPPLPHAATAHTKAGAIAFVRHYIDLINYAQATGDVKALNSASDRRCQSCRSSNRYLVRLYRSGGHVEGGKTSIEQVIGALAPTEYGDYEVDIAITIARSKAFRGNGSVHAYKGGTNVLSVFPGWHNGSWKVAQWTRAK